MMFKRSRERNAAGFTVVELLVVLVVLGIIGGIVAASTTRGLRADAQARSRIEAFEDMQIAMERVTRDVRAADPILSTGPNDIKVEVWRDDVCFHFTYELLDGGRLSVLEERFQPDCSSSSTSLGSSSTILVQGLDADEGPIFTYLEDVGASSPLDPDVLSPADVAVVEISFTHVLALDQQPATVRTLVGIRNR